jgi:small-conductance mechanosensitive channel
MPHRTDEDLIMVTWPHAFIKKAVLPVAIVISVPLSLYMASGVFDLTGVFNEYFRYPFLNVEGYISLSFYKIVTVLSLYFIFSFLNYVTKAGYKQYKIRSILSASSVKLLKDNQVNFTLAANVIGISLWGIYIISLFAILRIPTAAIKVIGAGLATGLGFAMKDILNNFFYGVQLMSGRLRVGDYVDCDGVRGKVDNITYQTTQIIAEDGSVMAFPNSTLFNKNFKNLTKNHSYELLSFPVGVKYGVDVEKAREVIIEALMPLQKKDKYGRDIIDSKFGIQVRFQGFGDSSVNLSVLQFISVEERYVYASRAKEAVYNALNANGIEIPFPQRDVYVKTFPVNPGV